MTENEKVIFQILGLHKEQFKLLEEIMGIKVARLEEEIKELRAELAGASNARDKFAVVGQIWLN